MPQVSINANLQFTNHWIGIYDPGGRHLIPSRRVVQDLQATSAADDSASGMIVPADVSTLVSVYEEAVERKARHAASNLGLFLLQIGKNAEAEAPLRSAISMDEHSGDPVDADREGLALALDAQGKRGEAAELFRQTAESGNPQVAARCLAKLAEIDPEHADAYYRKAVKAEEKASGGGSPRVALLLHQFALELRARDRDAEAQPLLRRALSIQQTAAGADSRVTIGVLNTLGNLLQGRGEMDEAEKLVRTALVLSEEKLGPESPQLAMSCIYLADILWSKKRLREAGLLYRRAIAIDVSIYGPDRPETAANIANLGMLMNEAGQSDAATTLLRQALTIYENTLGGDSAEARFVKKQLER